MNSLTLVSFLLIFLFSLLFPSDNEKNNDFNIKIEGQVVNKQGEISNSITNLQVDYIRNGNVMGYTLTGQDGTFVINGIITGFTNFRKVMNQIRITGQNPFQNETKIEVNVIAPGKVTVSSIDGKISETAELPNAGRYTFMYRSRETREHILIISASVSNWNDAVKLVKKAGRNYTGNSGLELITNLQYSDPDDFAVKSAEQEQDSIKITGKNISQTFCQFYHERQDVNLGQKTINQGPEIKNAEVLKSTAQNIEITTNLDDFVYNDDQSRFISRNQNFTVEGSNIKFTSNSTGLYQTWVDVIDGEDQNLKDSILYKVEVTEELDNLAPEFKIAGDIPGKEDEIIRLDLDKLASDNKTSPGQISWEITNGTFTESKITGREATLTPQKDRHGEDKFTATITDLAGNKKTQEFKIQYQSVPDKPMANDDTDNTGYNKAKTTIVLANDTDADNDLMPELTRIIRNATNGITSRNIDGSITYTPNNGFTGLDNYEYEISDATALKDTAKVTINVSENPNIAPIILDIPSDSSDEDTPKTGISLDDYVSDDFTSDDKIIWTIMIDKPDLIEVAIDANRQVEYKPKADKNGTVGITYTAQDEEGLSTSKKQNFTINPVNDAPGQISPIANQTSPEDEILKLSVGNKFSDPEGETITYKLLNLPQNWTLNWSGTEASISAPKDYNGIIEGLIIEATDSNRNKTQSNTFSITKNSVNDPPIAGNDNVSTAYQQSVTIDVLANDTDIDSEINKGSVTIKQNPADGTFTGKNLSTGEISYKPENAFNGTDSFKYTVKDSEGLESNEATVTITVGEAPNQNPNANDDSATTNEDIAITIDVLANDTDDHGLNPASVTIKSQPGHGSTNVNTANGQITFTPANDNHTDVTFQYSVADFEGQTDNATVNIIINPVDDAPRKLADIANQSNAEDVTLTFDVAGKFTEPDGEAMTYSLLNLPAGWTSTWSGTQASVSAPADYNGTITGINVEAKDPQNNAVQSNAFTITKTAVDDAPRLVENIANQSNLEDAVLTLDMAGKFNEPEGQAMTYSLLNLPAGWTSTWSGTQASVSAPADYNGTVSGIKVEAKDPGNNATQSNTFTITKTAVDDAPRLASNIGNQSNAEDVTLTVSVAGKFTEPDGEAMTYQLLNLPAGWSSTWNGTDVSVTAPSNYNGTISGLVVKAKDPQNNEVQSNAFTITKTAVNDPVGFAGTIDNVVLNKNASTTIDLKNYFSDVETADADLIYALAGLSLGTYSIAGGVLTITGTTVGNETDLRASASDEGTSANSNYFSLTVNDVVQKSTVTFDFKRITTDTRLSSGTSTLQYRIPNGTWNTATSTNGVIQLELDAGQKYEVEANHSNALSGTYVIFGLRRPSDKDNFDQQDANDKYQEITVAPTSDNIEIGMLTNDDSGTFFDWYTYAGYAGNKKVNPNNEMTIWWNDNYTPSNTTQRQWITDIQNQVATIPYVTIDLPFTESTTAPTGVYLEVKINTNLGNITTVDANNYITRARADFYSASPPSQLTFKDEIWAAMNDWQDQGGAPPFFDANGNLNSTGKGVMAISYYFKSKTEF